MTNIDAIILGVIQGLTEFLPVSSSGHLEIGKELLNDSSVGETSMFFTVVVHFATVLSTIVVYRSDIASIFKGLFSFKKDDVQFALKIALSMIPAAFVGVMFNDQIETLFVRNMLLVGSMLIVTGLILFLADKAKSSNKEVSFVSSILIGISQAIAILPGISRSGATISTSVLLGIDKTKAAKFSFLMVIPVILGKIAKDLMDGDSVINSNSMDLTPLLLGFIAAFVTGLVACNWMITLVKKGKLMYFSIYCFVVGLGAIIYSFV